MNRKSALLLIPACIRVARLMAALLTAALLAPPGPARAAGDEPWWDGFGAPPGKGMNDIVFDLQTHDGWLVAGGQFTQGGKKTAVNYVGRFNGAGWFGMKNGTNGRVFALEEYQGQLIAGGDFTVAGGQPAAYIAAWDGADWAPLGAGTDGPVEALGLYQGDLIAAGAFTTAGGTASPQLARWDGSAWHAFAGGLDYNNGPGLVQAIVEYQGDLFLGGLIDSAGGVPVNHLARWDGSSWSDFGAGLVNGGPVGLSPVETIEGALGRHAVDLSAGLAGGRHHLGRPRHGSVHAAPQRARCNRGVRRGHLLRWLHRVGRREAVVLHGAVAGIGDGSAGYRVVFERRASGLAEPHDRTGHPAAGHAIVARILRGGGTRCAGPSTRTPPDRRGQCGSPGGRSFCRDVLRRRRVRGAEVRPEDRPCGLS